MMNFCEGFNAVSGLLFLVLWSGSGCTAESYNPFSNSNCDTRSKEVRSEVSSEAGSFWSSTWGALKGETKAKAPSTLLTDAKFQIFLGETGTQTDNRLGTIELGPFFKAKKGSKRPPRMWPNQDKQKPVKVPDLLKAAGFDYVAHEVNTTDGYILTLFRLKKEPVCKLEYNFQKELKFSIIFQHGILGTAADWLVVEPENSFPLILHELGFDVWLANSRGNEYSMKHQWLKPSQPKFWNFSFDEMGRYDSTAVLDYIVKTTKHDNAIDYQKSEVNANSNPIYIVGHGMGTTIFYVCMSYFGEFYQDKVFGITALGPSAFLSRTTSPIKKLVPFIKHYQVFQNDGPMLPSTIASFLHFQAPELCRVKKNNRSICSSLDFFIYGNDSKDYNQTIWTRVFRQFPSTTSVKNLVHFLQQIEKDQFRRFDYGPVKNMVKYNQPVPPQYNLFNVTFTNMNLYGKKDILLDSLNVERTIRETATTLLQYNVLFMDFNHVDLIFGNVGPILTYTAFQTSFNLFYGLLLDTFFCNSSCIRKPGCPKFSEGPQKTAQFRLSSHP